MTLEQLKSRQQELNYNLSNLLDEQRIIVTRITGSEFASVENPLLDTKGIIDEIHYEQEKTNDLIKELRQISEKLSLHTFSPDTSEGMMTDSSRYNN